MAAELWSIWHGLVGAKDKNIQNILICSDSLAAVKLLCETQLLHHPYGALITACRQAMAEFSSCTIQHTYREANQVADGLARLGHSIPFGVQFFDSSLY